MFGVFMFALGASDPDPNEAVAGYVLGAIGVLVWVGVAAVAARVLAGRAAGRRRSLGALPALVSLAWCGLAAALLSGWTDLLTSIGSIWPASLDFLWLVVVVSFLSAGTIPVAFTLLILNIVLRWVRGRHGSNPSQRNDRREQPDAFVRK